MFRFLYLVETLRNSGFKIVDIAMDPIRERMSSLLTKVALNGIKALGSHSPCAKELSKIDDDGVRVITEEIEKISNVATLAEIARILLLAGRLKKRRGRKKESAKSELKMIAEQLVTRVETESGPLRLPATCRHLLSNL